MKWLVFLMMLPLATASILPSDCAFAPVDHGECQNIVSDTSLTLTEKEDLYLNLLNSQTNLPNYDFVWNWNNPIVFNQAPIGVAAQSNGIIQNVWLKIIGVNKSVYDTNMRQWFVQPNGQIQIAKNYSLSAPSGTLPGECQTTYSTNMGQNQLTIKANAQPIGTTSPTAYNLPVQNEQDLNFRADWHLVATLTTNHYQNRQHSFFDGWQWHYWTTCDFINTTQTNYALDLHDELPAKALIPEYRIRMRFDSSNQKIWLKINSNEPLNEIHLTKERKSFSKSQARVYWALINNMGKNVQQLEKETLLAHTTLYVSLAFLIKNRLVRQTNTRPKFYYCQPTLDAVKLLLKERKNQFNAELSDTYRDIKKIVQNATSQSGEKYLIEINGGQTQLFNYQTKEPLTWKHEIDQIRTKLDKISTKDKVKLWQTANR